MVKPIRTLVKICTSSDRMKVIFQSQIQDVTYSIRVAIEKGGDLMVVYVMALRLASLILTSHITSRPDNCTLVHGWLRNPCIY